MYYEKVLIITKDYLGPAAERFVVRQIRSHLHKPPEDIKKTDIPMLAIHIRSGLMVLTKDDQMVNEAFKRITAVGDA